MAWTARDRSFFMGAVQPNLSNRVALIPRAAGVDATGMGGDVAPGADQALEQ